MVEEEEADPDVSGTTDIREWTGNQLYANIKLAQDRVTWRRVASRPHNGLNSRDDNKTRQGQFGLGPGEAYHVIRPMLILLSVYL